MVSKNLTFSKLYQKMDENWWGFQATVLFRYGDLCGSGSVSTSNKKTRVQFSVMGWYNIPKQCFEVELLYQAVTLG